MDQRWRSRGLATNPARAPTPASLPPGGSGLLSFRQRPRHREPGGGDQALPLEAFQGTGWMSGAGHPSSASRPAFVMG
jgi:hypothetical protein